MHDPKHLEQLRNIRTPILYDAMEKFNVRSRTEGLMDTTMRPQLPSLGIMVGYATTGKRSRRQRASGSSRHVNSGNTFSDPRAPT